MNLEHNFQVDLRGIINLLSDHLYSGPEVYLRELLQNSIDAVTGRQKIDSEFQPRIQLELIQAETGQLPTIVITDNGVGLTEQEVHQFLSTIGNSTKRGINSDDFIGQFGIGMLSAFVVCEEVVVITQSITLSSPSIQWTARSDGSYLIKTLKDQVEPGTQVYLRCKPGCNEYFEPKFITERTKYYGSFLTVPIELRFSDKIDTINEMPPWQFGDTKNQYELEELIKYGENLFQDKFIDAIPLEAQSGGVEGVAFILAQASTTSTQRKHRIYLKNMLLSESAENLLPDWAFFVKCIVNSNELRPTAAREGFYEDQYLEATRDELGECIRQYLMGLAENQSERLMELIELHHLPMKSLAVEDDDFFEMIVDWLPFETSVGLMTLREYLKHHNTIRFVNTRDQFRQVASVAAAQDICLINGGYVYDVDLLQKVERHFPNRKVEKVDVAELAQEFTDVSLDEREAVFDLTKIANLVLQPFQCSVEIKKFEPHNLPTFYSVNERGSFLRSAEQSKEISNELLSGILDSVVSPLADSSQATLCLNYENPLIKKMSQIKSRELIQNSIEMLYVQSLLLGHYPLKSAETNLLNSGLIGLIDLAIQGECDD